MAYPSQRPGLIVTEGSGFYQEKDKHVQVIIKGDVVNIPENVEHWHDASATTSMTHVAITNFKEDVQVSWLQPVTADEKFNQVNTQNEKTHIDYCCGTIVCQPDNSTNKTIFQKDEYNGAV